MENETREQQAQHEAGHTTFRRGVAPFLAAVFLCALAMVPLVDTLRAPENIAGVAHLLPARFEFSRAMEVGGLTGLLDVNRRLHRNMEQFETRLEQDTFLRQHLLAPLNNLLTRRLGARNAGVCPGREDWLFHGPAVDHLTGPPFLERHPHGEDPLSVIAAFHQQLAARGIHLVVMPIPVKASIYPDKLTGAYDGSFAVQNASHDALVSGLRNQGALVCDPANELREARQSGAVYLAGDSHWTPHGQQTAIRYLGGFLRENIPDFGETPSAYTRGPVEVVENRGDLLALLDPADQNTGEGERVETAPVLAPDGEPWTPQMQSSVLLLGDSFANIYGLAGMGWGEGAGMAAALSHELQRPVDAITQNGDGAFATRLALNQDMARGKDRLAGKKVVVFAFSARELSLGDWKPGMKLAEPAAEAKPGGARAGTRSITATIIEQSAPPDPGTVPYKDCIIAARLENVESESDLPGGLLVYRWGMRNGAWTEAARQRSGEELRITIQPWEEVAAEYGSYNRVDLEGRERMESQVWWEVAAPLDTSVEVLPTPATSPPRDSSGASPLPGIVRDLEATNTMAYAGNAGWLFFLPELRFLNAGTFWGDAAAEVSRTANPAHADPLPAILDLHQQLQSRGVTLILAPVPAKASIYGPRAGIQGVGEAPPEVLAAFYEQLRAAGIEVVDLHADFVDASQGDGPLLYCKTDTHWSPYAVTRAARILAGKVRTLNPELAGRGGDSFEIQPGEVTFTGDIGAMLSQQNVGSESLPLWRVEGVPAVDRESPVLLMGDSHNLVFHAGGDMHAMGAGLPEHLAAELGMAIDLVAVRGSGATAPRINLARRRDNLAGKLAVIWCFSVREFTESNTGWRTIPVIQ